MNQREFFNSVADKWDNMCNHDEIKIKKILDLIGIKENSKILDIGTGTGVLIPFLLDRIGKTGKITAIDISDKMIEIAKKKFKAENLTFINADVLKHDIERNYYDLAICYSMFPHFEDKKDAIKKINEYLKIKGKLVICHSQSRNEINNLHKNVSEVVSKDVLPEVAVIKKYLNDSNFTMIDAIDDDEMFVIIGQKIE